MKLALISLAALAAAAGGAHAQSSVTLSGQLDAAATALKTTAGGVGVRKTGLYNAGMASSFMTFSGKEDLGGGLYAAFKLETGLNMDHGGGNGTNTNNQRSGAAPALAGGQGLTFHRWSYAALGSSRWGELRLGRVYTAAFLNFTPFDPFLTNGVGASSAVSLRLGLRDTQTALNVSNAIDYVLPTFGGGFFGSATLALGENPSNGTLATSNPRHGGDHAALRFGWGSGPVQVVYSAGLTRNTAGVSGTGNNAGDYLVTNLAGSYNFGPARVMGQYVTERLDGASAAGGNLTGNPAHVARTRTFVAGVVVPVGPGNIKFSYVDGRLRDNIGSAPERGKLFAVGYDYFFSKRTNLYAVYSHIANNSVGNYGFGAAYLTPGIGQSSTGLQVGLKHIF